MPTALSPVAIWRTALSRPNPGELASIASLLLFLDELCDRTEYNYSHHFRGNFDATRFNYVGSGAVNDYPAIRAAADAAIAAGGGTVWVPAGTSARLDTELVMDGRWHLKTMKGLGGSSPTRLIRNHANRLLNVDFATSVDTRTPLVIDGFTLEDNAARANPMIDVQDGSLVLQNSWAKGFASGGPLLRMASGPDAVLYVDKCLLKPDTGQSAILHEIGKVAVLPGTRFEFTSSTYNGNVIDINSVSASDPAELVLAGGLFDARNISGGAVQWVNAGGSYWSIAASGCSFRSVGVFPTAFAWEAGGERRISTSGNTFDTTIRYSGAGDPLDSGSNLEFEPLQTDTSASSPVQFPSGVASWVLRSNAATAPAITPPTAVIKGQRARGTVYNFSGGTWATAITITGAIFITGEAMPGSLNNGQTVSFEMEYTDIATPGTFVWTVIDVTP